MSKIVVLGNSGSGKSTLTTLLAEKLKIKHLHLDPLVFKYSWDEPKFDEMEQCVSNLLKEDSWIIDGNFLNNAKQRFELCNVIYFLDINRFTCLRSVLKRHKQYKGKHRDSRSDNCDERITKNYLKWVFFEYYRTSRKRIIEFIKNNPDKKVIVFKNRHQINKYLREGKL